MAAGIQVTSSLRSTVGQATSSGIVKGVCGVGSRSRPIFDRLFRSLAILSTRSGPRHRQSTPQPPFTRARPPSGTLPRRRHLGQARQNETHLGKPNGLKHSRDVRLRGAASIHLEMLSTA
jgi:hypothetical protein